MKSSCFLFFLWFPMLFIRFSHGFPIVWSFSRGSLPDVLLLLRARWKMSLMRASNSAALRRQLLKCWNGWRYLMCICIYFHIHNIYIYIHDIARVYIYIYIHMFSSFVTIIFTFKTIYIYYNYIYIIFNPRQCGHCSKIASLLVEYQLVEVVNEGLAISVGKKNGCSNHSPDQWWLNLRFGVPMEPQTWDNFGSPKKPG